MNSENKKKDLIRVLADHNASFADRDDAAMDLGEEFEDDDVLGILVQVGSDKNEIDMIQNSCGESIGKIWVKKNVFKKNVFNKLSKIAQDGAFLVIESRKPDWIQKYRLE
jgi:hypothetical protein